MIIRLKDDSVNRKYHFPRSLVALVCFSVFFGLLLCLGACEKKQEVWITGGAVKAESYMWCTLISFDEKWSLPGGVLTKARLSPPLNLSEIVMGTSRPFPSEFLVRWFHFGRQKFYEAKLIDPSLQEKAYGIVMRHQAFNYEKRLFVSIYDSGKVEFWFGLADNPTREKKYIELLAVTQGYEIEGDKTNFAKMTAQAIEEGLIPVPVKDKE
jgi:hypothetical protein